MSSGPAVAPQRVLVTGNEGYIGSIMAPALVARGHDVVGLDIGYYRECTLIPREEHISTLRKDIRDLEPADLVSFDAVIHLAALSNDPIGNLNDTWTEEINERASVRLAQLARAAGVQRFLFSSSCIMYGLASEGEAVNENSPLHPQTEYARSKVRAEMAIRELSTNDFCPTFLRNGTVYGMSPRMRFDTVFNSLIGSAIAQGEIVVRSDGRPWRPVVHVVDVAAAFATVLEAPITAINGEAFNTGAEGLNQQVIALARIAMEAVPGSVLEVRGEPDADQRTYRTDFSKFAQTFPDFRFRFGPREGAAELAAALLAAGLTQAQFTDRRFTRLRWIRHLLETRQVEGALRVPSAAVRA
jgi:nucleoside-diphosphate-sugar epimerase